MLTKENFLEKVQTIFEDTPKDEIALSTEFKKLDEWDSLHILGLIVIIEDNFSVLLSANEINDADTLDDLYLTIFNKNAS